MSEWRSLPDENIGPEVATCLDKEDLLAEHVRDALGQGADDEDDILPYAREHDLSLVISDVIWRDRILRNDSGGHTSPQFRGAQISHQEYMDRIVVGSEIHAVRTKKKNDSARPKIPKDEEFDRSRTVRTAYGLERFSTPPRGAPLTPNSGGMRLLTGLCENLW